MIIIIVNLLVILATDSNLEKIRSNNFLTCQKYSKITKDIDECKQKKWKQHTRHEPYLSTNAKINDEATQLTIQLENCLNEQWKQAAKEAEYKIKMASLGDDPHQHDSYHILANKLSTSINVGDWEEKEITMLKKKLTKLCKGHGFSKIARAFMAMADEPNTGNVTSAVNITNTNSGDTNDAVIPGSNLPTTSTANNDSSDEEELSLSLMYPSMQIK